MRNLGARLRRWRCVLDQRVGDFELPGQHGGADVLRELLDRARAVGIARWRREPELDQKVVRGFAPGDEHVLALRFGLQLSPLVVRVEAHVPQTVRERDVRFDQ